MTMPFPGMDPYLEHPVLWVAVHARMIVGMANQLQPRLDPRYVTSIEERVFEPDVGVLVDIAELEVHQRRIEILDLYNNQRLVAVIELVSPSNKFAGPGRESYLAKQAEVLARDCHFIEIDLLRRGQHVMSIPEWRLQEFQPYDYLVCVSRWPRRHQFTLYSRRLRERLPRVRVPLVEPDPDVTLDIQAALEQIYVEGRFMKRVRYQEPCEPALEAADQEWANQRWLAYQAARPELFPARP